MSSHIEVAGWIMLLIQTSPAGHRGRGATSLQVVESLHHIKAIDSWTPYIHHFGWPHRCSVIFRYSALNLIFFLPLLFYFTIILATKDIAVAELIVEPQQAHRPPWSAELFRHFLPGSTSSWVGIWYLCPWWASKVFTKSISFIEVKNSTFGRI